MQIKTSLQVLANTCRDQGMDLMTIMMTLMSGVGGGDRSLAAQAAAFSPTPTDAELVRLSHDLMDALDRGDLVAVNATLAPAYLEFVDDQPRDRSAVLASIAQRTSKAPYIARRTWDAERVVRKDDVLVFTGRAHEVQGGNETHGGYLYEGRYLLQWVRVGGVWRVQLLAWQKASTDRDAWNETFQNGRGFSLEPNRLLVEAVDGKKPGAALDLAMGQGRNALYLASQGWNVIGVDISDEGPRIAREQAAARELELETITADLDEWDFGVHRFDLVTLMYAGDHANWIDKIKTSLREGGLFVVEGWAKGSPEHPVGFGEGQLAMLCDGFEVVRDETIEDVPDWAWDKGKLVRFIARKK
ncbi:MAG: methyltransferase domain-containing protein [Gemmatimonadaceae bacterium]|nr:methyltransferase domain-containing protein [Gemmatimonadaceae bacterium]